MAARTDGTTPETMGRRTLVRRGAAAAAVAGAAPLVRAQPAAAQQPWSPPYSRRDRFLRRVSFGVGPDSPALATDAEYGQYLWNQTSWDPSVGSAVEDNIAQRLPMSLLSIPDLIQNHRTQSGRILLNHIATTTMRRIYSEGQLHELMVQFWHEHFNLPSEFFGYVSRIATVQHDRTIRPHALGSFADLLVNVVESPPLLVYLNNHQSRVGNINENFGRELLELYTLGDRDVNGQPNYSEDEVVHSARIMTGWGSRWANGAWTGEFIFRPAWHDPDPDLSVAGWHRPPGDNHLDHGRSYLRHLALHPATAQHVCAKIARYFMGDDVPQHVVDDMAEAWWLFGSHLGPVLRALLMSTAFNESLQESQPERRLLRRPMEHVVAAARAVGPYARPEHFGWIHLNEFSDTRNMDHRWPAPDGYPTSRAYWLNPSGMANRLYMATAVGMSRIPVCWWQVAPVVNRAAARGDDMALTLAETFLGESPHPRLLIECRQIVDGRSAADLKADATSVRRIAALCFSSPEFQLR